jgi:co-chaperonin GroES (HSP10)
MKQDYSPINNFCIVEVEKIKEDSHTLTNGISLQIDTYFNPGYYSRIFGTVKGIPRYLTGDRELYIEDKLSDIVEEVQVGDKIYFHHNTCTEENLLKGSIFRVPYEAIYCVVRNGNIIPIGGKCFCIPVLRETNMSSRGIILDWDSEAKPIKYPSGSGLAKVTHIGTPLKNQKKELSVGDIVLYTTASDFPRKIEGNIYYIMRQHIDIVAKIEN